MASPRVAVMSVHTSPMDQPGSGDSGGMNVYIRAVTERLARQGVEVDLFPRCRGGDDHEVREIAPGIRVVSVKAGPCTPVPKADAPTVPVGVPRRRAEHRARGRPRLRHRPQPLLALGLGGPRREGGAGSAARGVVPHAGQGEELLARPRGASGAGGAARRRVARDRRGRPDPRPHPVGGRAARRASTAPTRSTSGIVPPGVDHAHLPPAGPSGRAGAAAPVRPAARAVTWDGSSPTRDPTSRCARWPRPWRATPRWPGDLVLGIVGGPSGADQGAEMSRLMELAAALGVSDRVILFPPQPQERLADFYAAADVVLVPSRSESFGLVALEAQACGTPVVGSGGGRASLRGGGRSDRVPGGGARPRRSTRRGCSSPAGRPLARGWAPRRAVGAALQLGATADELLSVYRDVRDRRARRV